ncbi:hypothetical protein BC831DRAFT_189077 [Entophlyctis helioformis]|nr:hypothetical protein BC831DRAFT_189077 [Entophlyctis helioformis]
MTGGTGGGGGSVGVGEGSCASSVVGIPYPESDDLADRFGVDSQSSDDYTRSEVSTDVRSQASRFGLGSSSSGAAGRRLGSVSGAAGMGPGQMTGSAMSKAASGDMLGSERRQSNFGSSLVLSRRETVRNTDLALCRMCREGLHTNQEKILMCEICHIQIHAGCLMSTEAHPCAGVFNEEKIRSSFLKVFTSLLKSYRSHLKNLLKPEPVPTPGHRGASVQHQTVRSEL